MWDVLKGKGQKGGGSRDAWTMFAKPDLSQQPVQIEHPQQVVQNASGYARSLQECNTWDYSGRVGKMRGVMPGHDQVGQVVNHMVIEPTSTKSGSGLGIGHPFNGQTVIEPTSTKSGSGISIGQDPCSVHFQT
jgi:hypothetical protein